ncbi:MAG: porin [Aquabacterium sp.]
MFKKNLIAVAGLAVLASAAQAQVTLYGNVDLSLARTEAKNVAGDAVTAVESGIHTGSFVGLKGQEDLGGGLKGFFVLESDVAVDTGSVAGNFWGRTSELGLSGGFGTVKLGNSRSLGFLANAAYNPFPVTGLMNTSQGVNGYGNLQNSVTYTSPNLSGFSAAVQYGASETKGVSSAKGAALNYAAGPLAVGFNYSTEERTLSAGVNDFLRAVPAGFVTLPAAAADLDRWQIGASYDLGVAKLFAQYGQNKFDYVTGADTKAKFYQLGAAVPVTGQGTVLASYANHKVDDTSLKFRDFSVVYDHALSKRTNGYVAFKGTRAQNFAGTKETYNTLALGVKHAF